MGDALGAAVEFERPGAFEPVTGMRGGGPHGLRPGEWTDDTAMALCLAESINTTVAPDEIQSLAAMLCASSAISAICGQMLCGLVPA